MIGIKAYYYEYNRPLNYEYLVLYWWSSISIFYIDNGSATTFGTKNRERFHQLAQADIYILGTIPIIGSVVAVIGHQVNEGGTASHRVVSGGTT